MMAAAFPVTASWEVRTSTGGVGGDVYAAAVAIPARKLEGIEQITDDIVSDVTFHVAHDAAVAVGDRLDGAVIRAVAVPRDIDGTAVLRVCYGQA